MCYMHMEARDQLQGYSLGAVLFGNFFILLRQSLELCA